MYWASADRDEGEFERPDEFDIDRSPTATSPSVPGLIAAPGRTWPA